MKTHKLTEKELRILRPWEAVRAALDMQIKTYIFGVVFPRLGLQKNQKTTYDILDNGVINVSEIIPAKIVKK